MDKKKKILHVVGGMNRAGSETMLMNLYRNIDRDKVQFDFISYYNGEAHYDDEIKKLGGNVINIQPPNKIGIVKSVKELKKTIKKYGPYSAVHAHTLFNCGVAMVSAKLAKVNIRISHAHTTMDNDSSSFIRKIYFFIMRTIIKLISTDYLACSNSAARYLFGQEIIKDSKYKWFPNIIEYNKFINVDETEINSKKKELSIKDNQLTLCHIGRFVEEKNHKFIVKIAEYLEKNNIDYKILLIGEGPLKEKIEYDSKGLNIEFLGGRDDIAEILNCSDVFIMPSIYEGLGLVLLEAQASGIPCVVSEAIQPEADLGLGLIKKLSIEQNIDIWVENILESSKYNRPERDKRIRAFNERGYSVERCISSLMEVYKVQ